MSAWSPRVTLTPDQFMTAAAVGGLRFHRCRIEGRRGVNGQPGASDNWLHRLATDIGGAVGELAVCIATGSAWSGLHGAKSVDTSIGQVRHTPLWHGGLLLVPGDDADATYWLAVGTAPRVRVVGFMPGRDAMQERFWQTNLGGHDRPCWRVPQEELRQP